VIAGYVLLIVAWAMSTPPFSGPDEWAHFLRAAGVSHGQVLGARVDSFHDPNLTPDQEAWTSRIVRRIDVPPGLAPDGFGCNAFQPTVSAVCTDRLPPPPRERVGRVTTTGNYHPAPYLLPGLVVRAGSGPVSALLLARLANGLIALALLALAAVALQPALLGLVVATTPMALFLAAVLNPSGLEIAGSIAFTCGLIGLAREQRSRFAWAAVTAGAATVCLSRFLGPIWVGSILAAWLVWIGLDRAWGVIAPARGKAVACAAIVSAAIALNRAWDFYFGPRPLPRTEPLSLALRQSIRWIPEWVREQIGVFQYLETPMPGAAYLVWFAVFAALVAFALRVGTGRDRLVLSVALAAALAVPVILNAVALRPIGWAVQGRHVLPLTVACPLLAGEIVWRTRRWPPTRAGRSIGLAVAASCAVVHFVGFYANARRSSVGTAGSWLFPLHPEWSPPLGWWPWLLLAAAGAALITAARPEPT